MFGMAASRGNSSSRQTSCEGIEAGAVGAWRLLARQRRTSPDAPSCALAEAGASGRGCLGVPLSS